MRNLVLHLYFRHLFTPKKSKIKNTWGETCRVGCPFDAKSVRVVWKICLPPEFKETLVSSPARSVLALYVKSAFFLLLSVCTILSELNHFVIERWIPTLLHESGQTVTGRTKTGWTVSRRPIVSKERQLALVEAREAPKRFSGAFLLFWGPVVKNGWWGSSVWASSSRSSALCLIVWRFVPVSVYRRCRLGRPPFVQKILRTTCVGYKERSSKASRILTACGKPRKEIVK